AAIFVFVVFAEWAVRGNPDMLVLPGGPLPGIGPAATDGSVSLHLITAAIFAAGFGAAGFLAQGRSVRAIIPVVWSATAVFTPLALLLTFALEKGWLTIALALMSLGTAWISMQRPIPFLRSLSAVLAGIVVLRIAYEPRIVGNAVGTTPIFNWLLWGYGIPALSF